MTATVDLSAGAERTVAVTVILPDLPECEWFAFAVPIDRRDLDDFGVSARQVTLDVALDASKAARETVERDLYPLVVQRRRDARESAA